jgi:outer membrane murein-binding lipoprotein Lpp
MKKIIMTMAAFICAVTVFTGCNKDDDDSGSSSITSISATVESGSSYNSSIETVKAMVDVDDVYSAIASGSYSNSGFSISLPQTVDDQYLVKMTTDMPDGITVSDPQAKGCGIELIGYKSTQKLGEFQYALTNDKEALNEGLYVYADKNITIKGSYSETSWGITAKLVYDLSLKKGWNLVYMQTTASEADLSATVKFSNEKITGLKWFFIEEDDSAYSLSGQSKSATAIGKQKIKPFFL